MQVPRARASSWTRETDEDTTLVWRSLVQDVWNPRPPKRARPVADIRVDSEIRRALAAVVVHRDWTPSKPLVLRPNVFLTPLTTSDPPPPWAAPIDAVSSTPRFTGRVTTVRTRARPRSVLPLVAFGMAFGIGLGLWTDHAGRAELVQSFQAHVSAARMQVTAVFSGR
jgi:hypothetical protein